MAHGQNWRDLNRRPTKPRPATVIVVRGGSRPGVLLVQRTPKAKFMGGAWFPGGRGRVETHRTAAVREVAEEAGIALPDGRSRPVRALDHAGGGQHRFDVVLRRGGSAGTRRCRTGRRSTRAGSTGACAAGGRAGELPMVFPTIKTLGGWRERRRAAREWAAGQDVNRSSRASRRAYPRRRRCLTR
jgi:hypothetical protein